MIISLLVGASLGAVILAIPWITLLAINAVFGTDIVVNTKTWCAAAWLLLMVQAGRSGK